MIRSKKTTSAGLVLALGMSAGLSACKAKDDDESKETETPGTVGTTGGGGTTSGTDTDASAESALPDVRAIDLSGLGSGEAALRLQGGDAEDDERCAGADDLGLFSMALGGACHTGPMAGNFLMGEEPDANGDGKVDCDDYTEGEEDQGLLLSLMCSEGLQGQQIESLAFLENDQAIAIGFQDFGEGDAAGKWTGGDAASYPANIALWFGETFDALKGTMALDLESPSKGVLHFDFSTFNGGDTATPFRVAFDNDADATACAASPTADGCFSQDIKIYAGETADTFGPPNGFHLRIITDGLEKADQTFLALEGKYRYTDELAAKVFSGGGAAFADARTIYFRVVQEGTGEIWGIFDFQDANGETISIPMGAGAESIDIAALLARAEGNCVDPDAEDQMPKEACQKTYEKYDALWVGDAGMVSVTADNLSMPDVFGNPPTEAGAVLAE